MNWRGFIGFLTFGLVGSTKETSYPMIYAMIPNHPMVNVLSDASNTSPATGTAPTTLSSAILPSMRNDVAGRAERAGFLYDVEGKERRHHVANTGDEADQRIEPEADVGAGDQYSSVEQRRERVDPRDALGARLRSIQKDIIGACVCHGAQMGTRALNARSFFIDTAAGGHCGVRDIGTNDGPPVINAEGLPQPPQLLFFKSGNYDQRNSQFHRLGHLAPHRSRRLNPLEKLGSP